ncbi:hypothetical protein PHAVU_001G200800 [Phaseolus vulgaris]|uniref:Uncharacterized protein n=1 Tax=Phaseolus vulgaris TaxID=3885 RepID=V7D052_PHAVU|nr:hypothetical protein PHAVU_001G200800g [Phaseolus vulgaris]ESW35033.1 hypothetical protein PHAVU_001G200800g [Phaseolus vulgaris]
MIKCIINFFCKNLCSALWFLVKLLASLIKRRVEGVLPYLQSMVLCVKLQGKFIDRDFVERGRAYNGVLVAQAHPFK